MPYATPEEQREYQRKWVAKRRADWVAANGPCVKCGSWKELEIDHIDRALKISNSIWSWAIERRDEELAKCQVLCSECHKKKTAAELFYPWKHGTTTTYRYGCRCVECLQAHTAYQRQYRAGERIGKLGANMRPK